MGKCKKERIANGDLVTGIGAGAGKNMTVMMPVLQGIVNLLEEGPKATAELANGTTQLPPLIVAFTHDNQINELASILGVFDKQKPLSAKKMDKHRVSTFLSFG